MERSEKTEKWWQAADEMLGKEQDKENVDIFVARREVKEEEDLEVSDIEDEEEQEHTPLITACRKGMTEVS